jgi:hypothetical protein
VLSADPKGVVTLILPDAVCVGTAVEMLVLVFEVGAPPVMLNCRRLFAVVVWKLVPEIVRLVPATPIVGVKDVIVGAGGAATLNDDALASEPAGAVTEMSPVVAPLGTVTTSWVVVALDTVAEVPLNSYRVRRWRRGKTGATNRDRGTDGSGHRHERNDVHRGRRIAPDRQDVADGVVGLGGGVPARVDHRDEPTQLVVDVADFGAGRDRAQTACEETHGDTADESSTGHGFSDEMVAVAERAAGGTRGWSAGTPKRTERGGDYKTLCRRDQVGICPTQVLRRFLRTCPVHRGDQWGLEPGSLRIRPALQSSEDPR